MRQLSDLAPGRQLEPSSTKHQPHAMPAGKCLCTSGLRCVRIAHCQARTRLAVSRDSQWADLGAVLLVALFLRPQPLLVGEELLLHEQPVLYALQLQQPQLALRVRRDRRQLGPEARRRCAPLLAPHTRGRRRRLPLFLLLALQHELTRLRRVWQDALQCMSALHGPVHATIGSTLARKRM